MKPRCDSRVVRCYLGPQLSNYLQTPKGPPPHSQFTGGPPMTPEGHPTTHKHWHVFRLTDSCLHHRHHMLICDHFLEKDGSSLYATKMRHLANSHLCNSARHSNGLGRGDDGQVEAKRHLWTEAHGFEQSGSTWTQLISCSGEQEWLS